MLMSCLSMWGIRPVEPLAQSRSIMLSSTLSIEQKINSYWALIEKELDADLSLAKTYLTEVNPLVKQLNRDITWGRYYQLMGIIADRSLNIEYALKSLITAAEYFQKSRKYTHQSKVYLDLGNIFQRQWNHQKALDYYHLGIATLQKQTAPNTPLLVKFYAHIGRCNLEMKQYFLASEALMKGGALAKKANLSFDLCDILYATGQNQEAQKKYLAALNALKRADAIATTNHFGHLKMGILDDLSRVSLLLDSIQKAKIYGVKKKEAALQLQDSNAINCGNRLIAQAFFTENNLDSALWYNTIALHGARHKGRDTTERDIWVQRANILTQQNKSLDALLALEKAQELEDNIASGAQKLKAERLRQEMTIRRAVRELEEAFENKFRSERFFRYAMLLTVFLAALISLFLLFKVQIRQKANRQLKAQNVKIEEQKNQLEQLSQVKDQLFAVISHDLRSPLWAIQAVLDTLNEPDLAPPDRRRWLELLHQQTAKTSVMLENLLYWAKIQMNSYQPSKKEFKLQPIVAELIEAIQLIFLEKPVLIKIEIHPDFTLYSDPGMIRMALRNILANAVKFSHAGQAVEIRAHQEPDECAIQIKDYGIGMSPEQLDKALKGQLSRFGTKGEVGSGMGLSLVKQFIENQGGKLLGECSTNEGCTFTIVLPLKTMSKGPILLHDIKTKKQPRP